MNEGCVMVPDGPKYAVEMRPQMTPVKFDDAKPEPYDGHKPEWCIRCNSLRGKFWALCQRCGFHSFKPSSPFKSVRVRNEDQAQG